MGFKNKSTEENIWAQGGSIKITGENYVIRSSIIYILFNTIRVIK
jgi:hypothetical protein